MTNGRRRIAVADALAGVIGSLVSLWTFYPIDVLKTNAQASRRVKGNKSLALYRGLPLKTLHTISSSFCYFYIYSWIVAWWSQQSHRQQNEKGGMSTLTRLALSAIAAMLNTCLTLPLDVIAAQQQTKKTNIKSSTKESEGQMENVWRQLDEEQFHDAIGGKEERAFEEKKDESDLVSSSVSPVKVPSDSMPSSKNPAATSLWKGLWPSLLLCSNPSIHYTVFDLLKARCLQQRHCTTGDTTLSMGEAFFLGLVAKFVATMATYPLIRAKVMLMVTSQQSMITCIKEQYRQGGLRGCYKGCELQLFHTLLKSALLMMIRERITATTRRLLLPVRDSQ